MLWPRLLAFLALKDDATPPILRGLGRYASQISLLAQLAAAFFRATLANEKHSRVISQLLLKPPRWMGGEGEVPGMVRETLLGPERRWAVLGGEVVNCLLRQLHYGNPNAANKRLMSCPAVIRRE